MFSYKVMYDGKEIFDSVEAFGDYGKYNDEATAEKDMEEQKQSIIKLNIRAYGKDKTPYKEDLFSLLVIAF